MLNWDPSEVRSKENLDEVVIKTWESLQGTDWNMVAGMHNRLQEVIVNEGMPLRY